VCIDATHFDTSCKLPKFELTWQSRFEHHWIVAKSGHGKTQSPRLLRSHDERPCCRAAKRDYEFSPSDADCHVTLPSGGRVLQ
jgi:hypothetical protein